MYLLLTLLTAVFGLSRQSTLLWLLHSWCASYQLHPASANGPLCKRPKMFLAWRGYNWLPTFTLLGSLPTLAGSRKLSLLSSGPWDSEVTDWRSEHCIDWAFVGIWSDCLLGRYMLWAFCSLAYLHFLLSPPDWLFLIMPASTGSWI